MIGNDRDDVVAIVAHLTRIIVRRSGDMDHKALAADICSVLCHELGLDDIEVAEAGRAQACAMARPTQ